MKTPALVLVMVAACAPALRPELRPATINDLPPAMTWERALGEPSWWWPYGFGGWELGATPSRIAPVEPDPFKRAPILFGPEPGRAELLQHYRPTRAWRPAGSGLAPN